MTITESPTAARKLHAGTSAARQQLNGTLILTVTILGVSASNYLLNLLFARFLSPADFGDANLAVNLVLVAAAAAATLQLLSARNNAIGGPAGVEARRRLTRWAWAVGGAVGFALVLGSPALAQIFDTSTPLVFAVIGVGLPVYLAQAVMRGALQGDLRLGRLAASYAAEAATRVVIALVMLALGFGVVGAAVAISLSFVASGVTARHRVSALHSRRADITPRPGGVAAVSVAATVLLVGQVVIANGDVVLAKAVMNPEAAGTYAAAAIIGRALYFLSWAVVQSTFPVVARATGPEERHRALVRALAMVVSICGVGVVGLALLGHRVAPILLGDGYADAVDLLVPYALATALFAVANLVASIDLASDRWLAPGALLLGAALQTFLLISFGATPMAMTMAQVVAMIVTTVLVGVAHLCDNRTDRQFSQPVETADEHGGR
ncbi:oligosaccharide flippase family protein [Mycobacterium sp. Y57]|uniref:oligosaccharide flippase family protein n=1 Tax=Mycolicibacterium xanthum TaxID=2796469 RepID=UPI001C858816|nr:oligosaccharide flippase family protein [Mycolicibacterium xanthum]MBX7433108.1 oligosaccharide flippase family protein [Mycolicibacterium xanthum]